MIGMIGTHHARVATSVRALFTVTVFMGAIFVTLVRSLRGMLWPIHRGGHGQPRAHSMAHRNVHSPRCRRSDSLGYTGPRDVGHKGVVCPRLELPFAEASARRGDARAWLGGHAALRRSAYLAKACSAGQAQGASHAVRKAQARRHSKRREGRRGLPPSPLADHGSADRAQLQADGGTRKKGDHVRVERQHHVTVRTCQAFRVHVRVS